jgi:hypothetical protein
LVNWISSRLLIQPKQGRLEWPAVASIYLVAAV